MGCGNNGAKSEMTPPTRVCSRTILEILIDKNKNAEQLEPLSSERRNAECSENLRIPNQQEGGGGHSVGFESRCLDELKKKPFDPSGPDYQRVSHGLNFWTICKDLRCQEYNQVVCVNKGIGEFDFAREAYSLKCPACGNKLEPSTNCGFYMANWKFEGTLRSGEDRELSGCANTEEYYTFNETEKVEWAYIQVIVTRLEEAPNDDEPQE